MSTDRDGEEQVDHLWSRDDVAGSDFRMSALTAVFESAWLAIGRRHRELPERVAFTIATAVRGRRVTRWGHWAPGTWKKKDGKLVGEVFVAAERLEAGAATVMETIIHEAAHALVSARGVTDTSNRGRYHNKRYKAFAEALGLEVTRHRAYAWAVTRLPDATARVYEEEIAAIDSALTAYRKGAPSAGREDRVAKPAAKPRNRWVFGCACSPPREVIMTEANSNRGSVLCGICGATFRPLLFMTGVLDGPGVVVTRERFELTMRNESPPDSHSPVQAPTGEVIALRDGGELVYYPEFIAQDAASALLDALRTTLPWKTEMSASGKRQQRPTSWHARAGVVYAYTGFRLEPQPFTPELEELCGRLAQALGIEFNSALANHYRDGRDNVGWHADNERIFGRDPTIASISLGAERLFRLRHRKSGEVTELRLAHGSLLVMRGTTQTFYMHALPVDRKVEDERINLTFRLVANAEPLPRGVRS